MMLGHSDSSKRMINCSQKSMPPAAKKKLSFSIEYDFLDGKFSLKLTEERFGKISIEWKSSRQCHCDDECRDALSTEPLNECCHAIDCAGWRAHTIPPSPLVPFFPQPGDGGGCWATINESTFWWHRQTWNRIKYFNRNTCLTALMRFTGKCLSTFVYDSTFYSTPNECRTGERNEFSWRN